MVIVMSVSVFVAAKHIGEMSGWTKTNLELQKILYIANMIHLGREGHPLINEKFEAWVYGPVVPELYHRAKIFGADPVKNIFVNYLSLDKNNYKLVSNTLTLTYNMTSSFSASRLIAITHWDRGAWIKKYNYRNPSTIIRDEDILDEYNNRVARAKKSNSEHE